jgi:hypothetical protein
VLVAELKSLGLNVRYDYEKSRIDDDEEDK